MQHDVNSSTIYNSQDMEATLSVHKQMNGQGSDICMYESETENDSVVSDSL